MKIHLVCMGNICRSPMAEAVLKAELAGRGVQAEVTSSGTGAWHIGQDMDARALAQLRSRGYDGSGHQAQQFAPGDYDLVFAMDRDNLRRLNRMGVEAELFCGDAEVPDPYYDGGFDTVLDMIESASRDIADRVDKLLS